jgi:hypothetical protein
VLHVRAEPWHAAAVLQIIASANLRQWRRADFIRSRRLERAFELDMIEAGWRLTTDSYLGGRHQELDPRGDARSEGGAANHHRVEGIQRRHFFETAGAAGFPKPAIEGAIEEIVAVADGAVAQLADELPLRFPNAIHTSVSKAVLARLRMLSMGA